MRRSTHLTRETAASAGYKLESSGCKDMKARVLFGVIGFVFVLLALCMCSRLLCWKRRLPRFACWQRMRCLIRLSWCITGWS